MRSWRCEKRNSSRINGTPKSFAVVRGPPRSRTAIFSPVGPSSFERMPPGQPMPTTTISTGGSFDAMARSPSGQVGDAGRLHGHALSFVELLHLLGVVRHHPRKANHLPA